MKNFNFETFAEEQHEQFKDTFTLEEVKEMLYIGEDAYTKDSPNSTGKTLVLDFLAFKGKKDDGSLIDYSEKLDNGLTIWITKDSNLKGKSSLFKIIKFALTGENKISEHVKRWIEEIFLCFRIGTHHYTIHIINKRGLAAKLYSSKINNWEKLNIIQKKPIFETTTRDDFKKEIQNFFFKQFSYYSLNWTQSSTKKDSLDLIESSASWNTYFKSIYLESKDYGVLFYEASLAHQGQKLFQTLIGLDLTYAINQLKIKQDKLNNEKAKEQLRTQNQQGDNSKKKELLKQEIAKIVIQIEALNKKPLNSNSQELIRLQAEYKRLVEQYNYFSKLQKEYRGLSEKKEKDEEEISKKRNIYTSIKNRITSIENRILELQEYIQAGIFLSGLEIKNCPSCHHSVDDTKKKSNLASHKCPLCSDGIIDTAEVDTESYKDEIKQLQAEQTKLETQKEASKKEGERMQNELNALKNSLKEKEKALKKGDTNSLSQQIQATQNQIDVLLAHNPINNTQREELIAKKAVLEYQLKEIEINLAQTVPLSKYEDKIKLLEKAIVTLKKKRFEIGNELIQGLQNLMLDEIHSFGITSITGIKITENFDVKYIQGGEEISFEKIVEGEQLRAKLAFYLSLIQLDIEFAMGKHTRFLMIDSPGKEEAGKKYMDGLIGILQDIEHRYGDKLQILIATADSRFENKLKKEIVFQEEQFVF